MSLLEIREVTRRFGALVAVDGFVLHESGRRPDLERLEMLREFDPALRRTLSRLWTEIKVR